MKRVQRNVIFIGSCMVILATSSLFCLDDAAAVQSYEQMEKSELCSISPECCSQLPDDQLQELKTRLANVQERIDKLETTMSVQMQDLRKKEEIQPIATRREQLYSFVKTNAFNLITLTCTLTGLYMSYHFNNEMLKLNRASFIIDKGEAAIKNLSMVVAGQYAKYYGLIKPIKA